MRQRRPTQLEAGVFLVSFAVLLTELLLTRIFSVTMFYHLSFMVVSLAMLGFGASGLLVTIAPSRWFPEEGLHRQAAIGALLFALATVAAVKLSFEFPISLELSSENWIRLGLIYLVCAVPFFAGGLVVALLLSRRPDRANRLYFFDLLGAALGCVALVPATDRLGAPSAILFAAAVASAAGGVFAWNRGRWLVSTAVGLAGVLLLGVSLNGSRHFFDVRFVKGMRQPETLALGWNSFSRVDVAGTPRSLWTPRAPAFAGFSSRLDADFKIPEVKITYDADASTQITYFDGDLRRMEYLAYDVSSSVYHLRRFRDVLIVGPGGGRDVLTALSLGSGPVTGVEINPITVELMRTRFRTFSGRLYDGFPGVTIVNDEGRSFLRRQSTRYDLIEASLVDTWAASAAGAYALTENNLYTVDAFEDYFAHLTSDGVLCFNRWFGEPPVEVLKLVGLAREALARRGVGDPAEHVVVVRTDPSDTLSRSLASILVKASPFNSDEVDALTRYALEMGFVVSHVPGEVRDPSEEQRTFDSLLGPEYAGFVASYPFDIATVTDDRPFFFNRVPVVPWLLAQAGLSRSPIGRAPLSLGGETLLVSLIATAAATLFLLIVPYSVHRRRDTATAAERSADAKRSALWVVYFAGLGLGYILIEIVLIQRFSLFLGYPVYSLSVVLFSLLTTTALGSLVSARWQRATVGRMLGALAALLLVAALALPAVLSAARGLPIALRIAVAVLAIGPVGLLMGVPFASGVRWAGAEAPRLVPWAWAVNGGASVFGSTLAVVTSMTYGFTTTWLLGALVYAVVGVAFAQLARDRSSLGLLGALVVGGSLASCRPADDRSDLVPPADFVPPPVRPLQPKELGGESVRYGRGFYPPDVLDDGRTWHWTARFGEVRLRNDGAKRRLRLVGEVPSEMKGTPRIEVTLAGRPLDRFAPIEKAFRREYVVAPDVLGAGRSVFLRLETSAVARVPGDSRELGVAIEELDWDVVSVDAPAASR